jgi:hypothetical protein
VWPTGRLADWPTGRLADAKTSRVIGQASTSSPCLQDRSQAHVDLFRAVIAGEDVCPTASLRCPGRSSTGRRGMCWTPCGRLGITESANPCHITSDNTYRVLTTVSPALEPSLCVARQLWDGRQKDYRAGCGPKSQTHRFGRGVICTSDRFSCHLLPFHRGTRRLRKQHSSGRKGGRASCDGPRVSSPLWRERSQPLQ